MEFFRKLISIEVKFTYEDRKKGWLIRRKLKKQEFILKYQSLCEKAFSHGTGHTDYKTTDGLHLVGLARKELNFRDSTYTGDIYYGLWTTYQDLIKKK